MNSLSIVFQGPVLRNGTLCNQVIDNIIRTRAVFPQSEIIVSTWFCAVEQERALFSRMKKVNVKVILSKDPGPIIGKDCSGEWITNLNRLLISSWSGLQIVTRPLTVKLRTDTCLYGRSIESLLERYVLADEGPARDEAYRVFKKRVINCSWFARDAEGSLPYLFHPGDIFLAGLTEDVRLFFCAPLATPELFSPSSMPGLWCAWRYVPEQWFWIYAIRQVKGKMEYEGNFSYTPTHIESSERYFLANFVPFSSKALQFYWQKYYRRYPLRGLFSLYTHSRWLRLAARYDGKVQSGFFAKADGVLTSVWRRGYILRVWIMRVPLIRRMARKLFVHRKNNGDEHQHEHS
ncbi:WavE lipopolysaccharide synthesis [Enterobacter sp. J49]|uniref:WavE lipopolysaccharide synthesis family protein n=1 Tax=Enterobacter sp. J49 TaxID=1903627 RepID=UPI000A36B945|nr:WavE lipopolysaccharide synthesis family protein [Enterobacter sp. J49]OUC39424.1 WavE lipopolysaccharide synthesis [Enterobacter sp. J49]